MHFFCFFLQDTFKFACFRYEGYTEARLVDAKPGIAFVEFTGVSEAARAKDILQGFSITPTNQMQITFAKK